MAIIDDFQAQGDGGTGALQPLQRLLQISVLAHVPDIRHGCYTISMQFRQSVTHYGSVPASNSTLSTWRHHGSCLISDCMHPAPTALQPGSFTFHINILLNTSGKMLSNCALSHSSI